MVGGVKLILGHLFLFNVLFKCAPGYVLFVHKSGSLPKDGVGGGRGLFVFVFYSNKEHKNVGMFTLTANRLRLKETVTLQEKG